MPQGENGYVKDYRSTVDWEWFTDVNTAHLWEYIRLRVNYEPSRFRGIEIRRGEMLESLPTIAKNTGLSIKSVRTALNHLKSTGEVACKRTRYGMLIFAMKYAFFQDRPEQGGTQSGTPSAHEVARKWQESGIEVATYKENKNIRNKEIKKESTIGAQDFEDFWNLYPKKTGKQKAEEEWQRILSAGETDPADIVSGLETIVSKQWDRWEESEKRYIPAPARWLQEHRWTDEPDEYVPKGTAKKVKKEPAYMKELEELMKKDRDLL